MPQESHPWECIPLLESMRDIAPHVRIEIIKELDPFFEWDGDSPDPALSGLVCYQVEIKAICITQGFMEEHSAYLGGCYDKPGAYCPDIHGYLPQLIDDALEGLAKLAPISADTSIATQIGCALSHLKLIMRKSYEHQQKESSHV